MEKQRLMPDEESLIVSKMNHSEERSRSKNTRIDSNNDSSSSSFLGSNKSDDRKEKPNIMSVLSDFFGVKTGKVNSMAVSVIMTFFYLMSCESLVVGATPLAAARQHTMFHSSPSARNIRHLPCISRRTKEEGICMFAIDCLKANGTHLGTCIDRFYFGSCCQMPEQLDPITTNHIEDNSIFGQTFSKPKPDKIDQDDKVNNALNALSPLPSSTMAPATSPKTAIKTQTSETTQKPRPQHQKPGYHSEKPTYSSNKPGVTSYKPGVTSYKPGVTSYKPGVPSHKPSISSQKYGGSSQKPNSTLTYNKMPSTVAQGTRRPHPSTISHNHFNHTKKPITTGVFVNNMIYSGGKLPATHNMTKLNANQTKDSQKQPELLPSLKPTRNTTMQISTAAPISSAAALSTISAAPITTSAAPITTTAAPITTAAAPITTTASQITTTTIRSFYLPSRRPTTTTEKQSITEAPSTTSTKKSVYLPSRRPTMTTEKSTTIAQTFPTSETATNQKLNVTKPVVSDYQSVKTKGTTAATTTSTSTTITTARTTTGIKPDTSTEVPYKISTFQSVQGGQTKKPSQRPSPSSNRPFITGKPPPESLGSQLPFGTRLPSTTYTPEKHTTAPVKPTSNNQPSPTSRPSTVTPASPTISTTTASLPTQRPIQKPRPTYRPEKPTSKPDAVTTVTTIRPSVQRPYNSTLSNRRTTTSRPTTLIRKPIPVKPENTSTTSVEPTKRPTTIIYRPSIETKPSLKPTYINKRPASSPAPAQKPTTSVNQTSSHAGNVTRKPVITSTSGLVPTNTTTSKPLRISENTTILSSPSKQPTTIESSTEAVKEKPATTIAANLSSPLTTEKATTAKPLTTESASSVTKPASSFKPSQTTSKPYVRPSPPYVPLRPTVVTQKPSTTTTRPITNVAIEENLSQKPLEDTKKPVTSTTEKIGLVTWSNYVEPAVSQSSTTSTTLKDNDWSPVTPPAEWVLLQTISPSNLTGPTMQPFETVAPPKKPILDSEKPTSATPQVVSTTKSPLTEATTKKTPTKPVFTIHVTTRPAIKPASTNASTDKPTAELSTSMSVSESESTTKPTTSTMKVEAGNATTTEDEENTTLEDTTVGEYGNGTTGISEPATNLTTTDGEAGTTDKSTVSPIEGITSSGSPLATVDSLNMSDYKDVCGRRLWPEARVVGGSKANFGRWPWQVSLRQWRTSTYLHKCGAALLSENWAVTAAHCVDSVPPSDLLLRLGEHDLASEEEPYGFQERRVQIVASHPQFDPRTFEYDLALLRFYEPVTFQPNILPVCVPGNDEGFVGKTAYVTGWGRLYEDGPLPSVLQEVSVPVLENQACEQMYRSAGYIEHIPHIFICAGWRKGGFDSCEGDSGGPMVLQREDKRFLLAGIISWGIGCAEPNQPGVYTRISEFRDWINQILQF